MNVGHDPLRPHTHDPNLTPPGDNPDFVVEFRDGSQRPVSLAVLRQLPYVEIANCFVVSTGHGPSGPFVFGGARLSDLLRDAPGRHEHWRTVEVLGGDGFGTRLHRNELLHENSEVSVLLAYQLDGRALTRQEGLVRLIVPGERDDALRQVKWVSLVRVLAA